MGNGVSTEPFAATKLSPSSAALLWQDAPALLSDVRLEEGRVHFTAGEGQGNALIAVRDADGRILWSWHIWVTDYDPSSQAPKLNGLSWMTRNLGALSDDYDETGSAKGFVYQWGRKDPFPSGAGWNDLNDITVYDASGTAATDLFANEQVTASNNLQNAVEHPTTFYYGTRIGDDYYDWLTADGTAKNNRLWETAADGGKTLFDPCPPGWRVPRNGSWKGVNEANFIYDEAAFGRRHALLGYYPAAGNRGAASGTWSFVGGQASYWTSTATQEQYSYILNFLAAYLNPQSSSNRAAGCSVRCVSETQGEPDPEPSTGDTFTLTTVTDATYQGGTGSDGSANYYIGLSNVPFEIDDQGEQVPTEPGIILYLYLDLYGQASQDASAARLPEGTYTLKSGATTGTANPDYTWAREKKQDGTIAYRKPVEGEITVLHTQKGYLIEGTFVVGTEEENFAFTYEGELAFVDRTDPSGGAPVIREPVNVTFTSASATWEYTGDESDRYTIRLQEGTVEGGYLAHGHQLTIDLLSKPLSSKEEMVLAEGVYSPSNDYVSPMTFTQGLDLQPDGLRLLLRHLPPAGRVARRDAADWLRSGGHHRNHRAGGWQGRNPVRDEGRRRPEEHDSLGMERHDSQGQLSRTVQPTQQRRAFRTERPPFVFVSLSAVFSSPLAGFLSPRPWLSASRPYFPALSAVFPALLPGLSALGSGSQPSAGFVGFYGSCRPLRRVTSTARAATWAAARPQPPAAAAGGRSLPARARVHPRPTPAPDAGRPAPQGAAHRTSRRAAMHRAEPPRGRIQPRGPLRPRCRWPSKGRASAHRRPP